VLDWLVREGGIVLSWWALVTLAGAAVFPLCARLLGGLPDRGYTLARAAGLLLVGFVFWLLASFGFLRNTTGDMLLSWLIVLALSLLVYFRLGTGVDWRAWWRENRTVVIVGEILFATLLLGWTIFRAHQNNLTGTEKPMELMFMSSVQRSPSFPPNDGWMAGYAISYYYFGYVLSAMLSMLSGVGSTVGFNMTISLLFALTGLTAFGVVYNLVRSRAFNIRGEPLERGPSRHVAILIGALGMAFVVLMGNFQLPFVEVPYQTNTASADYLQIWNVSERQTPASFIDTRGLDPTQWNYWWWFRASRSVNDLDLNNNHIEVIDEFPQFSFLLADTHPHVLALPFVMLALGMALNLLLTWRNPTRTEVVFYGLCVGGLAFLNTWDGPVYLVALVGADGLRRLMRNGSGRLTRDDWKGLLLLGLALLGLTIVPYLPFWLGFRSQAGGILPNVINPTSTPQLFLMFGPFLLLLAPFLMVEAWRAGWRMNWGLGVTAALLILVALVGVMALMIVIGLTVPALRQDALRFIDQAGGLGTLLPTILTRRLQTILTTLVLLAGIVLVVGRLFPRSLAPRKLKDEGESYDDREERHVVTYPPATGFALLLVGLGLLLVLTPEFVYLRDNFSTRMNTIFKFYYQAWLVFSVAGAYGIYSLLADNRLRLPAPVVRAAYGGLALVVVMLGMLYPVFGIYSRMMVESGRLLNPDSPLTLDGGRSFATADDYQSIMCLNDFDQDDNAVIAEAVGGPYDNGYGRVAALTGMPTVIGWENHESQWRGPTYPAVAGNRAGDIRTLYEDPRWETAQNIIRTYGIDYIFYGQSERTAYGEGGEQKFRDHLQTVCDSGGSRFYRVADVELASNN
jgi:YYY domain-containing protein